MISHPSTDFMHLPLVTLLHLGRHNIVCSYNSYDIIITQLQNCLLALRVLRGCLCTRCSVLRKWSFSINIGIFTFKYPHTSHRLQRNGRLITVSCFNNIFRFTLLLMCRLFKYFLSKKVKFSTK